VEIAVVVGLHSIANDSRNRSTNRAAVNIFVWVAVVVLILRLADLILIPDVDCKVIATTNLGQALDVIRVGVG
jgi:hypothetical protein